MATDSDWVLVVSETDEWSARCEEELARLISPVEPRREFFAVQRLLNAAPTSVTWSHPTYRALLARWIKIGERCSQDERGL